MDSVDALLDAACEDTGLDDFGADAFREGLARIFHEMLYVSGCR